MGLLYVVNLFIQISSTASVIFGVGLVVAISRLGNLMSTRFLSRNGKINLSFKKINLSFKLSIYEKIFLLVYIGGLLFLLIGIETISEELFLLSLYTFSIITFKIFWRQVKNNNIKVSESK